MGSGIDRVGSGSLDSTVASCRSLADDGVRVLGEEADIDFTAPTSRPLKTGFFQRFAQATYTARPFTAQLQERLDDVSANFFAIFFAQVVKQLLTPVLAAAELVGRLAFAILFTVLTAPVACCSQASLADRALWKGVGRTAHAIVAPLFEAIGCCDGLGRTTTHLDWRL